MSELELKICLFWIRGVYARLDDTTEAAPLMASIANQASTPATRRLMLQSAPDWVREAYPSYFGCELKNTRFAAH